MPVLHTTLKLLSTEPSTDYLPTAVFAAVDGRGIGHFIVLGLTAVFVAVSTRLSMVDNDMSALPRIPPQLVGSWNPFTLLWARLFRARGIPSREFMGLLTVS